MLVLLHNSNMALLVGPWLEQHLLALQVMQEAFLLVLVHIKTPMVMSPCRATST